MRAPKELRLQLLDAFATYLAREPQNEQEQQTRCAFSRQAKRMESEFTPAQQALVASAMNSCRPAGDPAHEYIDAIANSQKRVSSDDFLAAAAMTTDPKVRASLMNNAVIATESENSPSRALEIMELIPEPDRDHTWYGSIATTEVRRRIAKGDWSGALSIIDRFSSGDRLQLEITAGEASVSRKDQSSALLLLNRATREMEQASVNDPMLYVRFLNLSLRLQPENAPAVLHRVVKALNDYKPSEADRKRGLVRRPIGDDMEVYLAPAALDVNPQVMDAAIGELQSTPARDAFRLTLLNQAIERHLKELQLENERPQSSPAAKPNTTPPASH
jgi:hypothetical protein